MIGARWRARRMAGSLAAYRAIYEEKRAERDSFQLHALETAWTESLRRSPWARVFRERLGLPDRFASWEQFRDLVPVQAKKDLWSVVQAGPRRDAPRNEDLVWRATGGTTAEPLNFPVFQGEPEFSTLDFWTGRARLGVTPEDRAFLLWGHSHLFGSGFGGLKARARRALTDLALGYTRWSAYRLSARDLEAALAALLRSRARYVLGYSTALARFAEANLGAAERIHQLKLKAVIATAESFPSRDARERVHACFGCPVVMEYGSVETGPIAYERPSGGYDVFWAHHRLEAVPSSVAHERHELVVTSLYPRALPIMRYSIGDLVELGTGEDVASTFSKVIGRCNDMLYTPTGRPFHSEAFTHAIRDIEGVRGFQIVRGPGGVARSVRYEADGPLPDERLAEIRRRLGLLDPAFASISVEHAARLERSIAGKSRMVVNEP